MQIQKISNFFQRAVLALIIGFAASAMLSAARGDSAIFDETAHIVAGYNYVKNLDYRFNPEHPPFIKMLAGLPLAFQNLNFSKDSGLLVSGGAKGDQGYWTGVNEQWWAGNEFLYKSGNDADKIIFSARIGPILMTLGLILLIYIFALEVVGRWWALLPAFLTGFSPIVLAHGHYVTTDVGAAFGMIAAIFYFTRYFLNQNRNNLIFAGLSFGLAQAIKFSSVLLMPLFLFLAIAYSAASLFHEWPAVLPENRYRKSWREFARSLSAFAAIIFIGYAFVVYPLYLYSTWNYPIGKQVADTEFMIQNFGFRPAASLNIWMAGNSVLRPLAQYFLGVLMVFQRQAGGNGAFFLGELSSSGWGYYFPLIYLMKESLPALLLIFVGGIFGFWRFAASMRGSISDLLEKAAEFISVNFIEFSAISFVAIYWASSISSPLNIGVRHVLPTIPFFYILATRAIKKWFADQPVAIEINIRDRLLNLANSIFNVWVKSSLVSLVVIWLILESSLASPNFLSYFNGFSGWREDGFYHATDSNFDWGQDLKRLEKWAEKNLPETDKIAVDYFGGGDPAYYLGDRFVPWWSAKGSPKDEGINWLAVSVNTLQGARGIPAPDFSRNPVDEYIWLENPYQPADRAGTSIFIYRL